MKSIIENTFIERLTKQFQRSPLQRNNLQTSDAEIIQCPDNPNVSLAVTIDSIAEEISAGLYVDPYLAGWIAVMANMSDLAAVGAQPLGILVSEVLPEKFSEESLARLQRGLHDACKACGTFILGGDTNFGERLMLTGCALGTVNAGALLSRKGSHPGDVLYASGCLGSGNAFALEYFMRTHPSGPGPARAPESIDYLNTVSDAGDFLHYHPVARLKEGQSICGVASSCMDTSDGVLATLDQLMRVNHAGFELEKNWELAIVPHARRIVREFNMPDWFLLAGQHGEFELLFTLPQERERNLMIAAERIDWKPIRLGKVIEECEIRFPFAGKMVAPDTSRIRNLNFEAGEDIQAYIRELFAMNDQLEASEILSHRHGEPSSACLQAGGTRGTSQCSKNETVHEGVIERGEHVQGDTLIGCTSVST